MGLQETIDSTLLPTTSNNVDVHMQKNTEYGAMLILAVSDYGKQGNGTSGSDYISTSTYGLATTTGNVSGIYGIGSSNEYVAAGYTGDKAATVAALYTTDLRYKNTYSSSGDTSTTNTYGTLRTGDTMDIATWQEGIQNKWLYYQYTKSYSTFVYYYYFTRNGFGYASTNSYRTNINGTWPETGSYYARAVVVCR